MTTPPTKKSDLPVRAASAVVMLAVAGTALWLGGTVWTVFVAAVALGVLWEWWGLTQAKSKSAANRVVWAGLGLFYVGIAAGTLAFLRKDNDGGLTVVTAIIVGVIATDVGAYFAGRTFGGPKIAPKISPSKTWAGFVGGTLATLVVLPLMAGRCAAPSVSVVVIMPNVLERPLGPPICWSLDHWGAIIFALALATVLPAIAQAGDFFQSWMKRRAGVKDSGHLIPGHGGLFDRVDGLLAVSFVIGLFLLVTKQRVLG